MYIIFVSLFRKIEPLQNIWFQKLPISDVFKHVRLQITFNRRKVLQISSLTVDYACFSVKCINYQNVMCFKDNLFPARFCKVLTKVAFFARNTTLAKFLQEVKKSCKNFARFLQKLFYFWTRGFLVNLPVKNENGGSVPQTAACDISCIKFQLAF